MKIIEKVSKLCYADLLNVWENSVRATHTFLSEKDIILLRPEVMKAFDEVNLYIAKDSEKNICGFIGIAGDKIEMLFVNPTCFKQGLGRTLIEYAEQISSIKFVDVNEQNPEAFHFYQHMGFKFMSKSEQDSQGNPFPILHLIKE